MSYLDLNGLAYYNNKVKALIENNISSLNDKIDSLIQPANMPVLPFPVYRSNGNYTCDFSSIDTTGSDWITIYCDSANGDDSNTGIDPAAPVKTYTRAEYRMRQEMNNGKNVVVQIADNSVFYTGDYQYTSPKNSAVIRSNNGCTFFNGVKPTFTQSGDHYVSDALTAYTIIGCVDTSETDDYGLYKPMDKKESVEDVDNNANSFYLDTTNKIVYVNPAENISNIVVLVSNGYGIELSCTPMTASNFVMFENINVVGRASMQARATSDVSEDKIKTLILKSCKFQHAFAGNALSVGDFENTYVVDCICGYTYLDGFNYHYTKKPTPSEALVVEVNSAGKEAGYYNPSGYTDQVSSCHEGANILRCNTRATNADGSAFTDIDGCVSVLLDCTAINTAYQGGGGSDYAIYRFAGAVNKQSIVTMQNCYGYNVRNSKLVNVANGTLILSGLNVIGTIQADSITVSKEYI